LAEHCFSPFVESPLVGSVVLLIFSAIDKVTNCVLRYG